ncbi:MAG: enoyl-CoA hydratase/isomerase family protein [Chloroflexi bacterium]|nr:enoyl-CoA hydratase/isomerase family protein [Chloroflexota bacterium]
MPVTIEKKGRVILLTLDSPETGNLLDGPLAAALERRCQQAAGDPDALALVLAARGDSFCLGESPSEGSSPDEAGFLLEPQDPGPAAVRAVAALPLPVIAAIQGPCTGAGVELALACDIRLAAAAATFQFPQLAEGALPRSGGTQRLPRIVGRGAALELLLLGERIDAPEAWRMGLVGRVVAPAALLSEAEALAQRLTQKAPIAVRYLREAVHKGMDVTLDQGLRLEADLYFLLQTTADRMEGIRAFLERRPPTFRGE